MHHTTMAGALDGFSGLDLHRTFTVEDLRLPQPLEADIERALRMMKKLAPEDQLNCGACGYATCLQKAIAVCQGMAEPEMCLPYLVEELELTCTSLTRSHKELEQAQQRLVQTERLASVGELSAGVAHELNNPLGSILLYSHMLLKGLKEGDARRTDLELVVAEAVRCKHIVRGLLDFARQSRVLKTDVDLVKRIAETMRVMDIKAKEAGVRLESDVQAGMPNMRMDGHQIKQVMINLVDNSIDAVRENKGIVRLSAHLSEQGDSVNICVSDTGRGIAPANLSKLFTPFFTTKEPGKGTGLGLAISYGIIKMHGGDINVESRVGQGTTFAIRLPIGPAPKPSRLG
jgi:signal transduction histidine kinase